MTNVGSEYVRLDYIDCKCNLVSDIHFRHSSFITHEYSECLLFVGVTDQNNQQLLSTPHKCL